MEENNDAYEVGYKKPPKKYRFKKGQSGNPGGRPKGAKRSEDLVIENLNRRMSMQVNGKQINTTVHDVVIKSQIKKAIEKGDTKAAKFVIELLHKAEENKYYLDTAADFFSKRIAQALNHCDPRQIEKCFSEAREISQQVLIRYDQESIDE